jgi:outer membrane protein OmpA-like peptidoglycan-associated protein
MDAPDTSSSGERRHVPRIQFLITSLFLASWLSTPAAGQQPAAPAATPAQRTLPAFTFTEGRTVKVRLQGTDRLPGAQGEARIERKRGRTEIEIRLRDMKSALLFGGDYNTYVLWTVSPEGLVYNSGEFILRGSNSELNASSPLLTFGLFVSAEPHFLVDVPSRFLVLEVVRDSQDAAAPLPVIPYREVDRGYTALRETLANEQQTQGEFRVDRQQAMTAVALAERAEAERHAPQELTQARDALRRTIAAMGRDPEEISVLAHHTVRLAVEARRLALERARQSAIDGEIQDLRSKVVDLERNLQEATQARRAAGLDLERYRDEAAGLKVSLQEAQNQLQQSQREVRRLSWLQSEAETAAEKARREAEEIRTRMQEALGRVAETRESARGLVVNLPDILFDSGRTTLRPEAKEVLSRVTGILLVTPGYRLSIEGHTDSTGSSRLNLELSQKRAQTVYDYLAQAGFDATSMTTEGFGESQPIDSNDTREGRQKNRRVEIVILDANQAVPAPQ